MGASAFGVVSWRLKSVMAFSLSSGVEELGAGGCGVWTSGLELKIWSGVGVGLGVLGAMDVGWGCCFVFVSLLVILVR